MAGDLSEALPHEGVGLAPPPEALAEAALQLLRGKERSGIGWRAFQTGKNSHFIGMPTEAGKVIINIVVK